MPPDQRSGFIQTALYQGLPLLRFLVRSVLAAGAAELLQLKFSFFFLSALEMVVPVLAVGTCQGDYDSFISHL
jgi:hypothetical protein